MVPPAPCTPNASNASSYPKSPLTNVTMRKHPMPPASPMTSAGIGATNPDAGVIATRPATAPEIAPSALGRPRVAHSAADERSTLLVAKPD